MNLKHTCNRAIGLILLTAVMIITLLIMPLRSLAQQVPEESSGIIKLSVSEAVKLAGEQNWDVRDREQQAKMARADFKSTKSLFLPSLEFSETFITTNDPVNVFSFKLKQGEFGQADFNPDILNNPDRFDNFATRVQLEQPLINIDGWSQRSAAKNASQAAAFMSERTKYQMEWKVKQWYFRAELASGRKTATQNALMAAEENLEQAQDLLEEGMIQQADVMAARVRVLELRSELKSAENQMETIEDRIKFLLNIDRSKKLVLTDSLRPFTPTGIPNAENPQSRTDLLALESRMQAQKNNLQAQKTNFLPRLNAFASYELNDDVFFGTDADNYVVGARLSWKFFNGSKNIHGVEKAKVELDNAQLKYQKKLSESRLETDKALRDLQLARDQLEILQLSVEQAQETFRIRSDRYEAGMVSTTDLLSAEAKVLSQRVQYLNALYNYHNAIFRIEFLTEQSIYHSQN